MSHPTLLSINDAMVAAGVSRRTIYNWLQANKLRYVRTAGGAVRIYADSLWRPGLQQTDESYTRPSASSGDFPCRTLE